MRSSFFPIVVLLFAMVIGPAAVSAQGGAKSGPDPATIRDPDLEKDSLHNLEVARHYFKLRKAYVAALQRCEEIIAGNPNFARLDEVLYIAGTSSLNLADNKGKQPSSLYGTREGSTKRTFTADEFRELGRNYLTQLVTDYPQSSFSKQAEEPLRALGGPKPKTEGTEPTNPPRLKT
ncbi:MAG: hypothetical protein ACRD8U_04505 [Pyrinomonadaceae bacterium]